MNQLRYASLGQRFAALTLDFVALSAVFFMVTRIVKGVWFMSAQDHAWGYGWIVTDPLCLIFLAAIVVYFILAEAIFGATLGKWLMGLQIVRTDGGKPGFKHSLVRNLLRVVDALPALCILGVVLIVKSDENARYGDRVAGTRVIDTGERRLKEILFEEPGDKSKKSRLFASEKESEDEEVIDGWQIFTWKGLVALAKNDHIQAATITGVCIITLAYVFKRVLHIQVSVLEDALPGYIFTIYAIVRRKAKHRLIRRPLLWNLAALLATAEI